MTAGEAIAKARQALAVDGSVPAEAWPVHNAEGPEVAYHLVLFGEPGAPMKVATVEEPAGAIGTWAELAGAGPHLPVGSAAAADRAGADEHAQTRLVWKPSRQSLSQLYPLWEVTGPTGTAYVDQYGGVWTQLDRPGPGGR